MKLSTCLLILAALYLPLGYAQSTINHQGDAYPGDKVVTGVGAVDMGYSEDVYGYKRSAMIQSENDASDKCSCGTLADYDCIERVSDWTISRQADRPRWPSKWFTVAEAKFKCIN